MSEKIAVAQALMTAWTTKDEALVREHLHSDFHFKGPMMELKGVEECVGSMTDCPFESRCENSEMVEQSNTVVHIFDWIVSAPFTATIPSVEVLEFSGKQVQRSRVFFDTALFPAEFSETM